MKRSKEFNNILDECLERLLVRGESLEQCLASYPDQAVELKPLLETALLVKTASAIQPRPDFRARARYQFLTALQSVTPKRGFFPLTWPRWATVVAVVLVLVLAASGTVMAAGNSMPDEPLYQVKLATEQVRLTLTPSKVGKAQWYAELADRRVAEIVSTVNRDKPEQLDQTTQRLDTCLAMIANLAGTQEVEEGTALMPPPEEGQKDKRTYAQASSRAKLRTALAHHAVNHPAALQAVLETAPASAKPALRRAIAVSLAGYKKALKAVED